MPQIPVNNAQKASFQIHTQGNVLLAVPCGFSDRATTAKYVEGFKEYVAQLNGQPWAQILFLNQWQGGEPSTEPMIAELANWCIANNLRCTAVIETANPQRHFQTQKMLVKVSSKSEYQRQSFIETPVALNWLSSMGFTPGDSLAAQLKELNA